MDGDPCAFPAVGVAEGVVKVGRDRDLSRVVTALVLIWVYLW